MGGGMGGMGGGFFNVADPPALNDAAAAPEKAPAPEAEGKTSSTSVPSQWFAQVRDPQPFRLDNQAVESRKKKP